MNKAVENEIEFYGDKETNDYGNLQPVDVMIGFYPELLGKEIPHKKILQASINLLLQKREDRMLAEKSEETEFVEIE